jgi:hypothetical protein
MMDGEITPCIVKEFEMLCENYFLQGGKSIPDNECAASLFASFENLLILDWLSAD